MILRRLLVRRFLGFPDASFAFAPGINVVVGSNEAGKSTLRAAIRTALYGNPATTSPARRDEFRTWGADAPPELVLEFEVGGKGFTLSKDFAGRKVTLTDASGRTWDQHKVVQERLAAALGLPTEELFEATAQVAQAELERIHLNSIGKELGRMIGGGGEDVATAIRRLDQHVRNMEKGSKGQLTKDPGILRTLEDRAVQLREEHRRLTAAAAEAERTRRELTETAATKSQISEVLASKRELLEINRRILRDEEQLLALKREETMLDERVKNIEETRARLTAINRELEAATAAGLPEEEAVRTARSLEERIAIQEAEAARLRHLIDQPREVDTIGPPRWRAVAVAGGAVTLLGLIAVLATRTLPAVALVVAGVIAASVGLWGLRRSGEALRLSVVRVEERRNRLAVLEEQIAQDRAGLAERLAQLGCASVREGEERLQHYRDLVRDRAQVAAFLADLLAGGSDETITERWKTVRLDIFGIDERLRSPEIASKRLTPLHIQALEREVEQQTQEFAQSEERVRRLAWNLERLATDAEALASVEEHRQEAEEVLEAARRRHAVYRAALSGLLEARRLAEVPLREVMEDRAGEYLRILSGGRYSRLQVEQDTLHLLVWSEEAGTWVGAAEPDLSRGTVDLVYLSARLALVNVLTGGKQPPLLFDDPFITFDERRRAAAAALLRELSQSHQVFVFTYTRHYDRDADRLIELPDRTDAAVAARQEPELPSVGPLWDHSRRS